MPIRVNLWQKSLGPVTEITGLSAFNCLVGDVNIGKRTILSYLVEGALRTGSEAMREP